MASISEEQQNHWIADIRKGDLYCPYNGCSWTFFTSFELAYHLKEDCKFGKFEEPIPCTHCPKVLQYNDLRLHWRNTHKGVVSVLSRLNRGISTPCANYLCSKTFSGTFEECKLYLKHSISCTPLYLCHRCKGEYRTRNILTGHQKICRGAIAKEDRKIVSKVETDTLNNITQRPKLSAEEQQNAISSWHKAISEGIFCCPVPSCLKAFFVMSHFVRHLWKESEYEKEFFAKICDLICPYCQKQSRWELFARHIQNYHRSVANFTNELKNGKTSKCPNYLCQYMFSPTTGCDYLKHALTCKPFYKCKNCPAQLHSISYFNKHLETCVNLNSVKSNSQDKLLEGKLNSKAELNNGSQELKTGYSTSSESAEDTSSVTCDTSMSNKRPKLKKPTIGVKNLTEKSLLKTKQLNHIETKYNVARWHDKIKSGLMICPVQHCLNTYWVVDEFVNHLRTCCVTNLPSVLKVPIPCLICKKSFLLNNLVEHTQTSHDVVFMQLCLLKQGIFIHCTNNKCKETFSDGDLYLKHVATQCKPMLFCARCNKEFQTTHMASSHICNVSNKSEIQWYEQIKKGDFCCPNNNCAEKMSLPRKLIEHLMLCTKGDQSLIVITHKKLPCCFCKKDIFMDSYCLHLPHCYETTTVNKIASCITKVIEIEDFLEYDLWKKNGDIPNEIPYLIINKEEEKSRQSSQFSPKSSSLHTETFKCVVEKPHIVLDNEEENVNSLKTSIVIKDSSSKSIESPYVPVGQVEANNTITVVSSNSLQSSNDVTSCIEISDNFLNTSTDSIHLVNTSTDSIHLVNTSTDSIHLVNEFFSSQEKTSTRSENEVTGSYTRTSNTVENASSDSIKLVTNSSQSHLTQPCNFLSNGKNDLVEDTELLSHKVNGKSKKCESFDKVDNAAANANQVCSLTVDPLPQYETSTISAPCSQSTPLIDSSKPKLSIVNKLKECKDDESVLKLLCNLIKIKKRKKRKVSQGCFCNSSYTGSSYTGSSYTGSWTVTDKVKKIKIENETKLLDINKKLTLSSAVDSKKIHSKFDMLLETCSKNCEEIEKDLAYSPTLVIKEQSFLEKCNSSNCLSKSLGPDVIDTFLSKQTQNNNFMQLDVPKDEEIPPGIILLEKPDNVKLIPSVENTFNDTDECSKHTETPGHAILKQVSNLECNNNLIHNEKSEEIKCCSSNKKPTFFQNDLCNGINNSICNKVKRGSFEMSNSCQLTSSYCLNNSYQDTGEQEEEKHINHNQFDDFQKDVVCNDQISETHPSLKDNTTDLRSSLSNLKNLNPIRWAGEITANKLEVKETKSLCRENPIELECEDVKVVSKDKFLCSSNLRSQSESLLEKSVASSTHFVGFIPDANKDHKNIDLNNDKRVNKLSDSCEIVGKKENEGQVLNKTVDSKGSNIHLSPLKHKKYLKRSTHKKNNRGAIKNSQSQDLSSNVEILNKVKDCSFPDIDENLVPSNTDALSLSCTNPTQIAHSKILTDDQLESSILTHQDHFSKKLESVSQFLSSNGKLEFYNDNKNDKNVKENVNFIDFKIESKQEKSSANGFRSTVAIAQESNKINREKFSTQAIHIHKEENSETHLLHKDSSAPLLQNISLQLLNLEGLPSNNFDSLPDFNVGQDVDLQEVQETNDIQCALQDLFMAAVKTPKSRFDFWCEDIQKYKMVCYFNDCNQSFLSPKLLVKHMMVCLHDSNKDWKTLKSKIISCAECNNSFKLHQYGTHYSTMHGLLLFYLKSFGNVKKARCQNYTCRAFLSTICSCVEHYRKCKFLWKCKKCNTVYSKKKNAQDHKKTCRIPTLIEA